MTKKIPPPLPSGNPESTPIGFLYVPSDLFNDFSLSLEEERILAIVRSYNGSCYWTEERFAEFCRCSTRTIIRVIKNLEERGRLRKESRGNQSNLYSEIPSDAQSSIVTNCHDDKMSHPYCQNVTSIVTNCHDDSDKLSPYIDIYNTKNKDNDNTEIVADAPTPTCEFPLTLGEPQDSEVPLESDSLKELTKVSEAPPLPAPPPKAKKAAPTWDDIRAQVSSEEWQAIETWRGYRLNTHKKKKAASIKSVQAAIEAYGANLIAAIHHSIGNRWEGIHYSSYSKPLGASGLTYQQQQTCFRDFWNEAHGLDRPDLSWVTKEQGAFLQKLMGRLCGSETAYVEVLAKKRSDQFDYQCRDFTNAIKELEQELSR